MQATSRACEAESFAVNSPGLGLAAPCPWAPGLPGTSTGSTGGRSSASATAGCACGVIAGALALGVIVTVGAPLPLGVIEIDGPTAVTLVAVAAGWKPGSWAVNATRRLPYWLKPSA